MRIETIETVERLYVYTLIVKFKDLTISKSEMVFENGYFGEVSLERCEHKIELCIDTLKKQIAKYGEIALIDLKDVINKYFAHNEIKYLKYDCSTDLKEITNNISDITIKIE